MNISETQLKPVGKNLLVKIHEMEKIVGGLEIADTATNNAPVTGEIIACGSDSKFSIGVNVMFRRYSVDEIKIVKPDGEQIFYFINDEDILATILPEVENPH